MTDWKLLADQHADTLVRVRAALVALQGGGHASKGRDFGRGVAHAASVIEAALAGVRLTGGTVGAPRVLATCAPDCDWLTTREHADGCWP